MYVCMYFLLLAFIIVFLLVLGDLGAFEISRAIRKRQMGITSLQSFPYSFGPYSLDESPRCFFLSAIVNLIFLVFGFGGVFLILTHLIHQ